MEIILGQARRCWSEDEKRALVAETFIDGKMRAGRRPYFESAEFSYLHRRVREFAGRAVHQVPEAQ